MENILSTLTFTLDSAVTMAIPLLLAALGEIFVQRSGCINMGMEGMMLMGAFIGVVGSIFYGRTAGFLFCIAAGVVFGLFTTFCNTLMGFLPTPENILIRLAMILVSVVLIAAGLFLYVPADLVPLAAEGVTLALAETSGKPFPRLKVCFDVTVVVISLVVCLAVLKSPGSVGIGTVAAAMLVGTVLGFLNRRFGRYRDRWLR